MELSEKNTTMSSREITELTGKMHKHVLVDCDRLNENYLKMGMDEISSMNYKADNKQVYREYLLTRMQTFDLMTGYNTELRIKVNRRWEELEKKKKEIDFSDPNAVLQLAQNWANEQKRRIDAEKQVKKLAPKAELMERILDTENLIDIGQAAKILELPFGRNTLLKRLRQMGILFRNRNEPKQQFINRGLFIVKEKFIERDNHPGFVVLKVLVTQKGLEFIGNLFNGSTSNAKMAAIK